MRTVETVVTATAVATANPRLQTAPDGTDTSMFTEFDGSSDRR